MNECACSDSDKTLSRLKTPELLAPAGTAASALAAFDAGADAIYAGLDRFNARERGENFSLEDFGKITSYAHKLKRKVYLTLNTLVKENELPDMVSYLADVSSIGPDAIIVQDLGVLRLIREYFPNLTLHASTQMGIHNSAGIKIASELGVKRVILERQITYSELKSIAANTDMELEVFVHGALCCSLSGECYLSSWLGGWSGNRGKCKQPCRRRFFSKTGNGFFLSTADLNASDILDDLRAIGVASLKIEGRLRQPDYVSNVVSAYRKLLDNPNTDSKELKTEARNQLGKSCGRRWSLGFFNRSSSENLLLHDTLPASGVISGKIDKVTPGGFEFTASRRLHIGDRLRVQPGNGEEGPALTITKMFVKQEPSTRVLAGERCFICCDKEVPLDGTIYKIGEDFGDYSGRIASLPGPGIPLDLDIELTGSGISVNPKNININAWSFDLQLEAARKHGVTAETLREEFSCGCGKFQLRLTNIKIHGELFLPGSLLKQLRRDFYQYLEENFSPELADDPAGKAMYQFQQDYIRQNVFKLTEKNQPDCVAIRPNGTKPAKSNAVSAAAVFNFDRSATVAILPDFCPERQLPELAAKLDDLFKHGIRNYRVSSLYGFEMLKKYTGKIKIAAATPLPIANSQAARELMRFGVVSVMAHVELERSAIESLRDHSPLPVEVYRFGRLPLLSSRAAIKAEGEMSDRCGDKFMVWPDRNGILNRVYSSKVLSLPYVDGCLNYYDLLNADWRDKEQSTFNFENSLI